MNPRNALVKLGEEELGKLDKQMARHSEQLKNEVKLPPGNVNSLATIVANEVRVGGAALLKKLEDSSPLSITNRYRYFCLYQAWIGNVQKVHSPPRVDPHLQYLTDASFDLLSNAVPHLYMSFIYSTDGFFKALRASELNGSCTKKCAEFIRNYPAWSLRNAIAHGNWTMREDGAIVYWDKSRDKSKRPESMEKHEVAFQTVGFYFSLIRCVSWVALGTATEMIIDGRAPQFRV